MNQETPSSKLQNENKSISDESSYSLSSLSFLNRSFTPSTIESTKNKKRSAIKATFSNEENGSVFNLVPSSRKKKPQWDFDDSSTSFLSTSDILERIDRSKKDEQLKHDSSSKRNTSTAAPLQDISKEMNNISVAISSVSSTKSRYHSSSGEADFFESIKKQTETVKELTEETRVAKPRRQSILFQNQTKITEVQAARRVIREDDTLEIIMPDGTVNIPRSSPDEKSTSSSSSTPLSSYSANGRTDVQFYDENETENSFQFPLQLWKKSKNSDQDGDSDKNHKKIDHSVTNSALGPPMRTGEKTSSELSHQLSRDEKSTDTLEDSSSGCNSFGSLFRSASSEENVRRNTNTSYISTDSELTYNNVSHDSLKMSSDSDMSSKRKTLNASKKRPPRSPGINLSSSGSSFAYDTSRDSSGISFGNESPVSLNKKMTSNKRPPRSPSVNASPSVDSPSRNTRSKKPRIGSSPNRSSPRRSPRSGSSPSRTSPRRSPRSGSSPSRTSPRRSPRSGSSPSRTSPPRNKCSTLNTADDSSSRNTRRQKQQPSPSTLSPSKMSSSSLISSPTLSFLSSSLSSNQSSKTNVDRDAPISPNNTENKEDEHFMSDSPIKKRKKIFRRETADTEMLNDLILDLQGEADDNEITKKSVEKKSDRRLTADLADLRSLSLIADPTVTFYEEDEYLKGVAEDPSTPPPANVPQKHCSKRLSTPFSKSSNDSSILNESNDDVSMMTTEEKGRSKVLKSILNSNRKQPPLKKSKSNESVINSIRKKTIAFGSPEVAEFNSNSPSGNFTPLPARQARALFKIPSSHNSSDESNCFDSTTSPINKVDDTTTIEVEGDVNSLLNNTNFDYRSNRHTNESNTVELESNVEEIMQKNVNVTESTNSSMEMDQEGESFLTKSIHNTTTMSPIAESRELSDSSESMLLSPYSPCSPSILKEDRNSIAALNANPFNDESLLDGDILCEKALNFEEHITFNEASEFSSSYEAKSMSTLENEEFPPIGSSIISQETDVINFLTSVAATNKSSLSHNDSTITRTLAKGTENNSYEAKSMSTLENEEFPPIGSSIISQEKDVINFLTSVAATNKSSLSHNDSTIIQTLAEGTENKMKCSWVPIANNNMSFGVDDSCITNHNNTQTYELEGNIEELVDSRKKLNEVRESKRASNNLTANVSPEALHLKQMRRLTLTSPGNSRLVNIMTDENTNESYVSIKKKENNSTAQRKLNTYNDSNNIHQHQAVDISYDEILANAGLDKPLEGMCDVLINASEKPYQSRNWSIVHTANSFLSAVCKEVKDKADSSIIPNFDEAFKENITRIISSSQEKRGYDLQIHLKRQLVELVKRIYSNVSSEWMQWEMQVTEAFHDAISRLSSDVESEECIAKVKMNLIDDAFEKIAMMEEKNVRKARRKSLNRRKDSVTETEAEIKRLESQIHEKQIELELVDKENELISSIKDQLDFRPMAISKYGKDRKIADRARWRYRNTERMRSWVLVSAASEKQMEIHFQGQLKETCVALITPLIPHYVISCKINPSIYPKSFRKELAFKCTLSLKNYITSCVSLLCNQINNTRMHPSEEKSLKSELQRNVHFWESSLCRIELGAQEISIILSRYDATLQRKQQLNRNKFSVLINFKSNRTKATTKKLRSEFWINEHYPFCFMEMNMEPLTEDINIDFLIRILNSRVKPGFRYLSRVCELIDSFLNC